MTERNETMWCTLCGARFTDEEIHGWGCPKCGNQGVPCGTKGDRKVEVNWHELHVLIVWAENYAQDISRRASADPSAKDATKVVTAIARRLQRQHPDLPPLTLAEEIATLPSALEKAGIKAGPMEVIGNIGKPQPLPINGPGAVGHSQNS